MLGRLNEVLQTESEEKTLKSRGYDLSIQLGQGGYAKVYLTEFYSPKHNRIFKLACKLIDTSFTPHQYIKKFLPQELKILTKLNHPHIVEIHSIFQRKNKYYIFMRYAEKGDLLDYVINHGPIKEKLARFWIRQIALAIQYLHTLEIAHRDIKCENILITRNYNIKLTDFGFSRVCVDNNHLSILSETFCGSISYVSPQIIVGDPYNPKATDMWSLGIVLYMMLNKSTPFNPANIKEMFYNQINKNFIFRSKYKLNYTKEVKILVRNLLEPIESLRYKIEDVLNASWISLDPTLKLLNEQEYKALSTAMEISRNMTFTDNEQHEGDHIEPEYRKSKSISFYKEYDDEGFDLTLLNSEVRIQQRLSA